MQNLTNICKEKNILLTVTVADCTPILLYDQKQKAIAAIHAGWRGTVDKIVMKVLKQMKASFGTLAKDCFAFIGTCIDECSFEVDADVADHFEVTVKRWDEQKGKFFINLKKENQLQLIRAGLSLEQIEISPYSTVLNNQDYFSYRKEKGTTGRMLAVIGMKS